LQEQEITKSLFCVVLQFIKWTSYLAARKVIL